MTDTPLNPDPPAAGEPHADTPQPVDPKPLTEAPVPEAAPIRTEETPADAVAETAAIVEEEPKTEGDADAMTIGESKVRFRTTPGALTHTVEVSQFTTDTEFEAIADHFADVFAPQASAFTQQHPNARNFVTLAVHAGETILHADDVADDIRASNDFGAEGKRLADWIAGRFPNEKIGDGETFADVVIRIVNRGFPLSAAESGIAAAIGKR